MAKVSKNIKQLRQERGMTQDELASMLHVTRQAISSWENDRTQPDVYMLGRMREIFGVSIEELLYGKKRNTTLELEKPDYTGTVVTVLSVLGGLLVAVGIILVFAFFWDSIPDVGKYILTQLPLVAGCFSFCYVYSRKRDKKPWCEGGAVVTLAGVYTGIIVSYEFIGLYKMFPGTMLYFVLCALAAAVMLTLKSVTALTVFCATFLFWCTGRAEGLIFESFGTAKFLIMFILSFAPVAVGEYFYRMLKKQEKESYRFVIIKWLCAIYLPVTTSVMLSIGNYEAGSILFWLSAVSFIYYILSFREKSMTSPLKFIGFWGMCFMALLCGLIGFDYGFDLGYELVILCFVQALLIICALYIRPDVLKSAIHMALCFVYLLIHLVACVQAVIFEKRFRVDIYSMYTVEPLTDVTEKIGYVMSILSLVFFVLLIFVGAKQKKLLEINIGFIGVIIQVMKFIFYLEIDIIFSGIALIICGGVLLFVNLKFVRKLKAVPAVSDNVKE